MSSGRIAARGAALVAALLAVGSLLAPIGPAAAQDPLTARLVLARQTPSVEPGGDLELVVVPDGLPPEAELEISVHDRVRTRSELTTSSAGNGLRATVRTVTAALAALPSEAEGRRATVALGADDGVPAVTTPGVYPVRVVATAADVELAELITHLIVRPPADTPSPALSVGVLARVELAPLTGARTRAPAELVAATRLVDAVRAVPDVAVTLAVRPDVVEEVAASSAPEAVALVASLAASADRPWLQLPYVSVSPDALADAGIPEELLHQVSHGSSVLREVLDVRPTETTWLAGPDLGTAGLALLPTSGVEQVLVEPDQIQTVADGVLSVARPFRLVPPRPGSRSADADGRPPALDAMVRDVRIAERLTEDVEPALVASRVLAELASLWFEQARVPRGVVVPVDHLTDPAAVQAIVDGLRTSSLFEAVPIDDLFTAAEPLVGRGRAPLERALTPDEGIVLGAGHAERVRAVRELRASVEAMTGPSTAVLDAVDRHLLRATSDVVGTDARRQEVAAARTTIEAFTDAISTQASVTVTLTAREGTVPLTIRNDSGVPVEVRIRLRSPRLELPEGDTLTLRLEETTTRRDIAVRTRASGAFPIEVEVTSPDGRLAIATARYSVRSTAVSGVGIFLSAGAGLFLVVWWARHWREARRSAKLVAATHPDRPESED